MNIRRPLRVFFKISGINKKRYLTRALVKKSKLLKIK